MGGKVKLGQSPSSGGRIFKASSSWRPKMVVVIDLISSDEDIDDGYEDRYDVDCDDEDIDDVLPPPPSSPECCKHKAPNIIDCRNKKV
jgi:hypothetical protein